MYLFAHLFTGTLIGLALVHLWRDRRLVPVCIAGSLFPDVLDKPLTLLMPGLFGSTRTAGHTLLLASALMLAALILWYRNRSIPGIAFAGTVFLHQLLDMLWMLPVTWFFPLHGMFPFAPAPGGFSQFLLLELTNPSEWVFALVSCIIIYCGISCIRDYRPSRFSGQTAGILLYGAAGLLCITGTCLILAGLNLVSGTIPVLDPGPDKTIMAGLVALFGAAALVLLPATGRPG